MKIKMVKMDNTDFPYKDRVRELFSSEGGVHYYSATPDAILNLARTGELTKEQVFRVFESDSFGKLERVLSGDISDYLQEDPAAVMSKQHMRGMRLAEYVVKCLSLRAMLNVVEINTIGKKAWKGPLLFLLYEAIVTGGNKNLFKQLEQEGIHKGQFRRALKRAIEKHDVPMLTISFEPEIYEAFDFEEEATQPLRYGYFKTDKIPIQYIHQIGYLSRDEWNKLTPEQKEIIPKQEYPCINYRCEESGLTDRAFLDLHSVQAQFAILTNCKSIDDVLKLDFESILVKTACKFIGERSIGEKAMGLLNNRDFGRSPIEVMKNIADHLTGCEGCRAEYEKARALFYGT